MITSMLPQPQPTNAVGLVAYAELMGLSRQHEITLITVVGPDPLETAALEQLRRDGFEVYATVRSHPLGAKRWKRRWQLVVRWLSKPYPWRTVWFWEERVQQLIDEQRARKNFDLITVQDNAMGIYNFGCDTPTVLTEHEVRVSESNDGKKLGEPALAQRLIQKDQQRWQSYQRWVWRRFDRLQVFTPRDAEAIGVIAPELRDRVRINPFGIRLPRAADPKLEENGRLVFVGGFTHPPNVDAALWLVQEIMPRLRARCSGVRLTIVGSYPPDAVRALDCADILVTGRVPEVEPYIERASVVVAPVRIGGGMRMKVLQAMALGKAVVTTPLGVEGLNVVNRQPPLVIACDADEIARVTADLLACESTRRALGQRAREFVKEHYSAPAYAQRLEAVFDELARAMVRA